MSKHGTINLFEILALNSGLLDSQENLTVIYLLFLNQVSDIIGLISIRV